MDGSSGGATSQPGPLPASSSINEYIMHVLDTTVTPGLIHTCANKHALFSRCSFYINIIFVPANIRSRYINFIDPVRLERVKEDAKTQVRLQMALQTDLLTELRRGLEELQAIARQIRLGNVVLNEDTIHSKISRLLDAAVEFEDALLPGTVHNRHKLIFEATHSPVPQIQVKLKIKMPVIFNKANCVISSNSIILYWSIEKQKQHKQGKHFQIQYKVIDPNIDDASNQLTTKIYSFYSAKINDLMPDTLYEFTIKRLHSCFFVYSIWTDAILLKTLPDSATC